MPVAGSLSSSTHLLPDCHCLHFFPLHLWQCLFCVLQYTFHNLSPLLSWLSFSTLCNRSLRKNTICVSCVRLISVCQTVKLEGFRILEQSPQKLSMRKLLLKSTHRHATFDIPAQCIKTQTVLNALKSLLSLSCSNS